MRPKLAPFESRTFSLGRPRSRTPCNQHRIARSVGLTRSKTVEMYAGIAGPAGGFLALIGWRAAFHATHRSEALGVLHLTSKKREFNAAWNLTCLYLRRIAGEYAPLLCGTNHIPCNERSEMTCAASRVRTVLRIPAMPSRACELVGKSSSLVTYRAGIEGNSGEQN